MGRSRCIGGRRGRKETEVHWRQDREDETEARECKRKRGRDRGMRMCHRHAAGVTDGARLYRRAAGARCPPLK